MFNKFGSIVESECLDLVYVGFQHPDNGTANHLRFTSVYARATSKERCTVDEGNQDTFSIKPNHGVTFPITDSGLFFNDFWAICNTDSVRYFRGSGAGSVALSS